MSIKPTEERRDFKGIWIPKEIWLNPDLTPIEKLFIVEIDSLDNDPQKGCFASNEYFGNFFGIAEGTAANIISDLKKREFLFQVFFDGRHRGLRVHQNVKAGFTKKGTSVHENVKAGFTKKGRLVARKREPNNTVSNPSSNTGSGGERTPPAPNPSNLKEEKKENSLVAPGRAAEDAFDQWLPSLHTAMENNAPGAMPKPPAPINLGFCGNCMGLGFRHGRNGRETCEDCDGSGNGDQKIDSAQFEVTAIASPTDLPGVTLVEAAPFTDENGKTWHDGTQLVQSAPIHPRRNGRIEIPDEAAAEIMPWANGDGAQTVKGWYSRAFRAWSPSDVESMVFKFSTVFLSSEKAATRNMMETDPLAFFKKRFSGFIVDQPAFDRMNAPKEGSPTRNAQSQKANLNHWGANTEAHKEKQAF